MFIATRRAIEKRRLMEDGVVFTEKCCKASRARTLNLLEFPRQRE
jgi:hypothetical protein